MEQRVSTQIPRLIMENMMTYLEKIKIAKNLEVTELIKNIECCKNEIELLKSKEHSTLYNKLVEEKFIELTSNYGILKMELDSRIN